MKKNHTPLNSILCQFHSLQFLKIHDFKSLLLNLAALFLLIALSSITTFSQDYPDSKGKDFWLTFMPNFHNHQGSSTPKLKNGDSLYIFITADKPCTGSINYTNRSGDIQVHNFQIIDINKIHIFQVMYRDFELFGFNNSGSIISNNNSHDGEKISPASFHITSTEDISVYAHSQATTTSDAFIVLPTDALGNQYFIMSYNTDGAFSFSIDGQSTPSQFAIVATEDNTSITIIPSTDTYVNGLSVQTKILNRGDVYLVQAEVDSRSSTRDLTGSEVTSDKPIAVFAGHQRARVPIERGKDGQSRDFLCEQMPPLKSWGKDALLVPYPQPEDAMTETEDIFRILAAYDDTEVTINGQLVKTLNKGQFYQNDLVAAATVKANAPILVAQYKKTSSETYSGSSYANSDPFITIIPPVQQFGNFYRFINVQASEYQSSSDSYFKVYNYQYVQVVAPKSTLATIRLDGMPVPVSSFVFIPFSDYAYATLAVKDGTHTISADEDFGIYVFGYGKANSYAYFGGMNFRKLDFNPPQIASKLDCFQINGIITDTLESDSRIKEVKVNQDSVINANVTVEAFNPTTPIVRFDAELIDIYQDGSFLITAMDSMQLRSSAKYDIPGFTLKSSLMNTENPLPGIEEVLRVSKEYCYKINIENYGKFPQELSLANFKAKTANFTINANFPISILPGEVETLDICFYSDLSGDFNDTLEIENDCANRLVYHFALKLRNDNDDPQINSSNDPCNRQFSLAISDSLVTDFGLSRITIIDTINCDIQFENFNSRLVRLMAYVRDQTQDAYFKIIAEDSVGHISEYEQSIPGYTIELQSLGGSTELVDFGEEYISYMNCTKLLLHNYGMFKIVLNDLNLFRNIDFSIPQSQLPLTILPGDTGKLTLCYIPRYDSGEIDRDTLIIKFNCLDKLMPLAAQAESILYSSETRCGEEVNLIRTTFDINLKFEINPNPVSGISFITIDNPEKSPVNLLIYNSFGQELINKSYPPASGILSKEFDFSDFTQGLYFIRISNGFDTAIKEFVIQK